MRKAVCPDLSLSQIYHIFKNNEENKELNELINSKIPINENLPSFKIDINSRINNGKIEKKSIFLE